MIDVSTASFQSNIKRDVYIQQPKFFFSKTGKAYIWKLKEAADGLGESAKRLGDTFSEDYRNWVGSLHYPIHTKYRIKDLGQDNAINTGARNQPRKATSSTLLPYLKRKR